MKSSGARRRSLHVARARAWKEAALQREQENARLLDLNNVRLDPNFTKITGVVLADSGSPFRQTVLLNVGRRDGIVDGWDRDRTYIPAILVGNGTKAIDSL